MSRRLCLWSCLIAFGTQSIGLHAQEPHLAPPMTLETTATGVSATSAADEVSINEAARAIMNRDYSGALQLLEGVPDDHPAASYYRGLSYLALGDYARATEYLGQVADHPAAPAEARADFDAANLAQSGGQQSPNYWPDARWEPDYVLSNPEACFAMPENSQEPKRWNLTFLVGYEYDSNVGLSPEFSGLGSNTVAREDNALASVLWGDYRLLQGENWNVGIIGSAYSTLHNRFEEFDLQDYMGGAYMNYLAGSVLLGTRYEFHETLLGQEQFAMDHRLVPSVSILEGDFGHTTFFYEFDVTDIDAPALVPAQERSGQTHGVGATQAIYTTGGDGRLFAGYRYEEFFAEGDDFDRSTHQVNARIEQPLSKQLIVDAGARYFWDNYRDANSLDWQGRPREDNRLEVRAGVQYYIPNIENLSLRVDYTYINSDSNTSNLFGVAFFEYDRHLVTSQLIFDF